MLLAQKPSYGDNAGIKKIERMMKPFFYAGTQGTIGFPFKRPVLDSDFKILHLSNHVGLDP